MFRNGWKFTTAAAALMVGAGWAAPANATNGYFVAGYDVQSKGMAGIGVSLGDGVVAAASNPALGLKSGNSAGACINVFMPHRDDTNSGGNRPGFDVNNGTFNSESELFVIPCVGANFKVNDTTAVSVLMYANGGMNTDYKTGPANGFGGVASAVPFGIDLEQAFIQPSLAKDIGHGITLGGGPVMAVQRFMAQGATAFDNANSTSQPGHVTNNGYDYSYGGGFKIGVTYDPVPWATLGLAYQTRTWMSRFHKYAGFFADSGSFDIPPAVTEGFTVRPIQTLDVSLEHQHIFYGDVKSVSNTGVGTGLLGTGGGAGFGWKDMDVFRVGLQWKATDDLTLRTGYSYNTMQIEGQQAFFNIYAPGVVQHHASIGASYDITQNWEIGAAYTHAFSNTLTGWNQNDSTQTIKLRMDQDEASVGIKYKW